MSSIFGGLSTAKDSLAAQQLALEITQKNIANVNTPGYTRQRAAFTPADPADPFASLAATGAPSISVESFRDRFIDYRINQELQGQGEYEASSGALRQIEALLNENGGQGLQAVMTNFFNSFTSLANAPEDMTLRQQVLSRADELTVEFHRIYDRIQGVQAAQDRAVADTVSEINSLTERLAKLNASIGQMQGGNNGEVSTLEDQRQQLLDQLSGLIDISYFETESGALTITTRQGAALVVGNQSGVLQAGASATGDLLRVQLGGQDITSAIGSGRLGGLLRVRDTLIPSYMKRLDDLAAAFSTRVNAQHTQGSDYNGSPGGVFFVPFTPGVGGSTAGAAQALAVAISDAKEIAAAGAGGGVGSNANARLMAAIRDEKLFESGGATAIQFYAHLIAKVGADVQTDNASLGTATQLLAQLQNQRDSISGVNLDEEAINIIRYQKAYEASARLVQVWDSLAEEVIRLLGN